MVEGNRVGFFCVSVSDFKEYVVRYINTVKGRRGVRRAENLDLYRSFRGRIASTDSKSSTVA